MLEVRQYSLKRNLVFKVEGQKVLSPIYSYENSIIFYLVI